MNKDTYNIPQKQDRTGIGFIKLSREVMSNPYYFSESFSKSSALIDLFLLASFKVSSFSVRGIMVHVAPGQLAWSQKHLAQRWQWSVRKVKRFLDGLVVTGQIAYQNSNVTTLITVHSFQESMGMGSQMDPQKHSRSTPNDLHYKKVKKEKNIYVSSEAFYQDQLKQQDIHPDYKKFVSMILGENDLQRPLEGVLGIPEQLTPSQFKQLIAKHKKGGARPLSQILLQLENDPKYTRGKQSLFTVLNNWLSNNFKNEKNAR
ncbi:MAG: hypothetical protein WCK34_16135 [Bacteroidota bacterium]